ncbi:MAG: cupin domain-containing protein [Alphaproteobacteria bacterium]|nr:cupin domain-containing protein [Alphaproteobacteria bacterium]
MSRIVVHTAAEIPYYQGPHEIEGIRFRHARKELGVTAWGMNVLDLAPHCEGYPEHDHAHDGQEEVYVVLEGAVDLHAGGEIHPMRAGQLVRLPANVTRKLVTGEHAARVLAIGGTPGAPYAAEGGM